jgi:hypothetical protein
MASLASQMFCPINRAVIVHMIPRLGPAHGASAVSLTMGVGVGSGAFCRFGSANESIGTVKEDGSSIMCATLQPSSSPVPSTLPFDGDIAMMRGLHSCRCRSPPSRTEKWVSVKVRTSAYMQSVPVAVAYFFYHQPVILSSISPKLG